MGATAYGCGTPPHGQGAGGPHRGADFRLGVTRAGRAAIGSAASEEASRLWWDADAADYHAEHGGFLGTDAPDGDFVWCPEGLREADAQLLGPTSGLAGQRILEIGCGSAPCARWLARRGAHPVAVDVSMSMLRRGAEAMARPGAACAPLVQAGAERLPVVDAAFDAVCSAFGAVPFAADSALLMREAARALRPGGRWVFSVNHPMRWVFPDDPGPAGLTAAIDYFDRTPYVEADEAGRPVYVEHHRTLGDRVREIVAAGLVLDDIVEPEWPAGLEREWGQWSPLRGRIFPGTAIFCTHKPETPASYS